MNTETAEMGSLIRQQLGELRTALERGQRSAGAVAPDPPRSGTASRIDALLQHALKDGFKETALREQRRLEAALARFAEGTFGACCQCGIPLNGERLQADPGAPFCAACQEAFDDRRQRPRR